MNIINGKKAYSAATLLALYGILGYVTGELPPLEALKILAEALAIAGLRHAIAKA
jgi:hypothetical protein|tara:strand:+ start:601 stop:765 length:165 start_codon:yes stop_codon:yes gene_type:complete